jgi:Ca2+-binding RTX toxin-like protein
MSQPTSLRRLSSYRPVLEALEARDCPSTAVLRGHTLYITGDNKSNQVTIDETREGDTVVQFEVGDPHRFRGVRRYDLKLHGGNDVVDLNLINPPWSVRADLGGGTDRLMIRGFDPQPDPPLQPMTYHLLGGAGNDFIGFDLGELKLRGPFQMSAMGGAGNDVLEGSIVPCIKPGGRGTISFGGDAGQDRMALNLTWSEDQADLGDQALMQVIARGGAGHDDIRAVSTGHPQVTRLAKFLMYGGVGNDVILGTEEADTIYGDAGNDIIRGGAGNDELYGLDGDDVIHGGSGDDKIIGKNGNDKLFGGEGGDVIQGNAGHDTIHDQDDSGASLGDNLNGGSGNDQLYGNNNDWLWGELAADIFHLLDNAQAIDFNASQGDTIV